MKNEMRKEKKDIGSREGICGKKIPLFRIILFVIYVKK